MGNRLSPITAKHSETGTSKSGTLTYAASAMQGRRSQMEDAHLAIPDLFHDRHDPQLDGHALFAVFDGHGGAAAAKFASKALPGVLLQHQDMEKYIQLQLTPSQQVGTNTKDDAKATAQLASAKKTLLKQIFEDSFIEIDRQFLLAQKKAREAKVADGQASGKKLNFKDPGTTALAVLVTPDFVVCANAGDCRAMLIEEDYPNNTNSSVNNVEASPTSVATRNRKALPRKASSFVELSKDHRPDCLDEEKRITKAGGYVFGGRLEDDLAVSRGFGDYRYKEEHITIHGVCGTKNARTAADQKVSPHPEIKFLPRKGTHKYIFLGCDGVFEQMSNDKVCRELSNGLQLQGCDLEGACHKVCCRFLPALMQLKFFHCLRCHFCFRSYWTSHYRKEAKTT